MKKHIHEYGFSTELNEMEIKYRMRCAVFTVEELDGMSKLYENGRLYYRSALIR